MIDTKELRRLAQAATPGPWWVNQDSLNHGFECGVLEINAKDWHALAGAWGVTGAKPSEEGAANAAFIAAANPAAINELLDRLEATEKERDALRAKIEEMEKQEPVAWLHESRRDSDVVTSAVKHVWQRARPMSLAAYSIPLYLAPGAQPAPSIPEGWLRAIDEALVVAHIGVANASDTYEQAKSKLDNLIGFHVDVATDPAVNGGWKLVPIEPMPSMPKLHVGNLPTINQDGYPALGAWWVQLWDGDDVFARVYGSSPEEAHNRAEMLAAAPEAKP